MLKPYYIILVSLVLFLSGCSNLTLENYNKLKAGMAYEEVTTILGRPDSCSEVLFARNCTWGNEKRNVAVTFIGGKVMFFSSTNIR
jgi:hypothetical protein